MTREEAAQLKRAIRILVRAEVAYSWRVSGDAQVFGAARPARAARIRVSVLIARLTEKTE